MKIYSIIQAWDGSQSVHEYIQGMTEDVWVGTCRLCCALQQDLGLEEMSGPKSRSR